MKEQKNDVVIYGDFILSILIVGIILAYYFGFLNIDWYWLGYWVFHVIAFYSVIQILLKVIKFIYNYFKIKEE